MDLSSLPGGDLVQRGVADLVASRESVPALVVSTASHWFRSRGFPVAEPASPAVLRLWECLYAEHGDAAHARYNSLTAQLTSFQRAFACAA